MRNREAKVQFELHYALETLIRRGADYHGISFTKVENNMRVDGGYADLVIYVDDKPEVVIETKRKTRGTTKSRFDPNYRGVILQAFDYASVLGAPFFATYNGDFCMLFETFKKYVPLTERLQKPYDVRSMSTEAFANRLLRDVAGLKTNLIGWPPVDELLIARLHTFHNFIYPFMLDSLKMAMKERDFAGLYRRWLDSQGFCFSTETHQNTAKQVSYLLMNKLFFYKFLERKRGDIPKLTRVANAAQLNRALRDCFAFVVSNVDYRAVFGEDPLFDEVPIDNISEIVNEFIDELSEYDFDRLDAEIVGRIYEKLIPRHERHSLGQYYTPTPIVDLIVKLCVRSGDDIVLDPACGSGTFPIRTYKRLAELNEGLKTKDRVHKKLLQQIFAGDINQFPAHLTAINLSMQDVWSKSDVVNVFVDDFFNVPPKQSFFRSRGFVTANGVKEHDDDLIRLPAEFDAVVTNPPYTRQEEMTDKKKVRKMALQFGKQTLNMSARAGIYSYFFLHGTKFLKNCGRLGMITSNAWLDVDYGSDLKDFFLSRFRILCVISYDKRVFEDASINTAITILEKAEGKRLKEERDENLVKFLRIKRRKRTEEILETLLEEEGPYEDAKMRLLSVRQGDLEASDKWSKFLLAPPIYLDVIENDILTDLGDIAEVARAVTTGANQFFVVHSEDAKHLQMSNEYLYPVIRSPRELRRIAILKEDTRDSLLLIPEDYDVSKDSTLVRYVRDGERRGYPKRPTCSGRKPWFSLAVREPAPILFPKAYWDRFVVGWNMDHVQAIDRFYEVRPKNSNHSEFILSYLNSSVAALCLEVSGRTPLGEGALDIMAYEVRTFPIPDPQEVPKPQFREVCKSFRSLVDAQLTGKPTAGFRRMLDKKVLGIFGYETRLEELIGALKDMRKQRQKRKEVDLLVDNGRPRKDIEGISSLDDWSEAGPETNIRSLDEEWN